MHDVDDTEAQARFIERDIERTRQEMDHTLSQLEERLAPSEILHSGAETVRESVRSRATSTVEALKRHPLPIALAAVLIGARFALRKSAADRRAEQDFERAVSALGVAFGRAQERAQVGASNLAELARDAMNHPDVYATPVLRAAQQLGRRATEESRMMGTALRREAGTYPLGALVLFGMAAGMAMFGTRAMRGWR
jgi:uncharacterized protein DUF3618